MIRRNLVLASAIAGVFGLPSLATAVVNLDDGNGTVKVIGQRDTTSIEADSATSYSATVEIGREIANEGGSIYVRFELDNGAKFDSIPDISFANYAADARADMSFSAVDLSKTLSSGGSGFSYAIYSIKHNTHANGAEKSPTDVVVNFKYSGTKVLRDVATSVSEVNLKYNVHRIAEDAAKNQDVIHTKTAKYVEFDLNAFQFGTTGHTLVADVGSNFMNFRDGNTYGKVADVKFSVPSTTILSPSGTKIENISDVQPDDGDGGTIKISGNFAFLANSDGSYDVANVFLSRSGCSEYDPSQVGIMTTASLSAEEAVINVHKIEEESVSYALCVSRNLASDNAIGTGEYYLDFTPKAASGIRLSSYQGMAAGRIARDGTVLDVPYFTTTTGYISRIMLSNFSSRDVNFTVRLQSDKGNVITPNTTPSTLSTLVFDENLGVFTGTIKANALLQINSSDLVSQFSTKARGSAKFTIVSSPQHIDAVYQTVNLATGEVANVQIVHESGAAETN